MKHVEPEREIPDVAFDPPSDPLFRDATLSYHAEFPVLGIAVRFESNSRFVIDLVKESFGMWASLMHSPEFLARDSARVRLFVNAGDEGETEHAPVSYRWPDPNRCLLKTPGSFGVAELDRLEAYAFVTPRLVADVRHFQYAVLEALTLVLVTGRDRHPVHAATIARNGVAILLAGRSGAGKSTLAYAAACTGFAALGEDVAYVQLDPEVRIWAMPGRIYLPPDASARFPELRDARPSTQANGKDKIAVDSNPQRRAVQPVVQPPIVCLLELHDGPANIDRVLPAVVESALTADLEPGFDRFPGAAAAAAAALSRNGGWRLHLSGDPREGVQLLRQVIDAGAEA